MLHQQGGALPSGLVIANEYDPSRCDKLVHNVGRVMSPCLITGEILKWDMGNEQDYFEFFAILLLQSITRVDHFPTCR